ncbi:MAG: hypothetical protein U1E57_04040 [Paenacidovorax caeni]
MNKTRLGALAPLILALAACGGGSGDGPAVFPPGEVLTFAATLDDGSTQETRYLVHAVTADGDLVAGESTAKLSPHRPPLASVRVALPLEAGDTPQDNVARLAALRDFYKQLWQGIAERRNDGSDIAAEIGAFESDVGVLYDDYRQSEFASVKDYVAFYEQVGENPYFDAQESVEEELVQFFAQTGWSQGAWLRALQAQNTDWPRFLALMAQRGDSFAGLLHQYKTGNSSGLEDFVAHYVNSPFITERQSQVKKAPWPGASDFHVVNPSWKFWIKNDSGTVRQEGERYASILSFIDRQPWRYPVSAQYKGACPTRVHVHGRANVLHAFLSYEIHLDVSENQGYPWGTWLPKVGVEVMDVDKPNFLHGGVGNHIIGAAEITNLENSGTEERPKPRFNVVTKSENSRVSITPRSGKSPMP